MPSTSTNQPKNKQTDRNVWLKRWVRKKKTTYKNFWKERTTNFRICINEWFIQNERVFCAYVAFTPLWACSTCSPHLRVRPLRENKFAPPQNPLTLFLPRNPFLLCRHHNMLKRAKTALNARPNDVPVQLHTLITSARNSRHSHRIKVSYLKIYFRKYW